jgi:hypothetical protein
MGVLSVDIHDKSMGKDEEFTAFLRILRYPGFGR